MKDRRTLIYLILISMFLISMLALLASAESSTQSGAKSYVLYNPELNLFLSEKNMNMRLPMASTTKILTALIAIEKLNPDEPITITKESVGIEGSSVYLAEGDVITVRDLIYSVLLQSANDASVALALRIGGTIESFAEMMNTRASEIGATDTNFENPHGLDSDNHYTTAKDLALIAAAALSNDTFRKISSTQKYSFNIGDKTRCLVNHNKLLSQYDGCIGVKTGYTKRCGRCLVSAAYRDGITLVAVTLSDPNDWQDHKKLLDLGFSSLQSIDLKKVANIPDSLPVIYGCKDSVKICVRDSERYYITKNDSEAPKIAVNLIPYVTNSVKAGDALGEIIITEENNTKRIDIIAQEDVRAKGNKFPLFAK